MKLILKSSIVSIYFVVFLLINTKIWGDDIWFIFPSNGQPVTGNMEIKIHTPPNSVVVNVWIEHDRTDDIVWMGQLTSENQYSIIIDTTRFKPGKYEINAEYFLYDEDFDGDIDIWVNAP